MESQIAVNQEAINHPLSKEYLLLKLRITFNKELYEKELISYDIYSRMQQFLLHKMDILP